MPATPSYVDFNPASPDSTSDTGLTLDDKVRSNQAALRDDIISGKIKGFVFSRIQGTGADVEHAQFFKWASGTTYSLRATNTWTTDKITSQLWQYSTDNESTWQTVHASDAVTYDASLNVTGATVGSGISLFIYELFAKLLGLRTLFNAHTAATGTSVHGLGTSATSNLSSMAITGGSIKSTPIGTTTGTEADVGVFKVASEKAVALGTIASGGTLTMDFAAGSIFTATAPAATANFTIAFANIPASNFGRCIRLYLTNGGRSTGTITYPSNTILKKSGGSAFTLTGTGLDVLSFDAPGDGTVHGAVAIQDSK